MFLRNGSCYIEPRGVTSQKTAFFIVTALKTSNRTYMITVFFLNRCKFFSGENKPKNILQLAGRSLLAFMFITLLRFEFSCLQASQKLI
jgi:hypothetical protein